MVHSYKILNGGTEKTKHFLTKLLQEEKPYFQKEPFLLIDESKEKKVDNEMLRIKDSVISSRGEDGEGGSIFLIESSRDWIALFAILIGIFFFIVTLWEK